MTIYPDEEEVLIVGELACGSPLQIRDSNQFKANVNRPVTTVLGRDAFPTAWDKAAALLHSFCTTQSLFDGNKRTGWAACWLFLRLNLAVGPLLGKVDADASEHLVERIVSEKVGVPEIADALRSLVAPFLGNAGNLPSGFSVTKITDEGEDYFVGVGKTPDGTRFIYLYLAVNQSTPIEMVLTPDQAREAAEELLQYADNPLEKKRIKFKARAIQAHLDMHDWSRYI
ncbi:Fic family protein [Corynebacterium aurimucosum]|uniref:type II toxin-antitoxin system death-on-curing family toxin n=1 Tax=Corynebacterium TaxID=1716 RepID=UPI00114D3B55|nr:MULTISPECIES: Fic family protein [unclassified Corynebacterium]MBE7364187.1 Fic family protein [Corynebacterium aurimucosum]MCG7261586.1 Fic family protein [Corynebacterium aurimucosum]MDK8897541.1 Fic family protein [Corynebacterium sp. MSK004]HCT9179339.1 Fic family protein [Corynebacterium aurimucosum]